MFTNRGLPEVFARGLAAFLNSSLVDLYFRQFSGHTQANSGDLRVLRYPSQEELESLGLAVGSAAHDQETLDRLVEEHIGSVGIEEGVAALNGRRKIDEALGMLKALDLPREQQNERSALTLLALLGLKPEDPWSAAGAPLMGITPMMTFFAEQYGKTYCMRRTRARRCGVTRCISSWRRA